MAETILAGTIGFIISSLINLIIDLFKTKKTYKNEYYKKLIEKRFNAYENIEWILANMQNTIQLKENEYFIFFESKKSFNEFHAIVMSSAISTWWLNQDIIDEIYTFNNFLSDISHNLTDTNLEEMGIKHFEELRKYYFEIKNLLLNAFKNLHEVSRYFKNLKDNSNNYSYANR